jgi:hypothetical protein
MQHLNRMSIWILEVERRYVGRVLIPVRKAFWFRRSVFYLVLAQPGIGLIHVADNDHDVLKPPIVAARVNGYGTTFRGEMLAKQELHSHLSAIRMFPTEDGEGCRGHVGFAWYRSTCADIWRSRRRAYSDGCGGLLPAERPLDPLLFHNPTASSVTGRPCLNVFLK